MAPITQYGSFTQQIANQINQNINAAGVGFINGNIIMLDPFAGVDTNDGITAPVNTLTRAYSIGREGKNDVIALIGNGLTTATARVNSTFTWAKDALHLVGVSSGSRFSMRSRIAPGTSTTAFTPFFKITSAGCLFQNVEFFDGFATGTTAQINMQITGARNVFVNCQISGMGDTTSAGDAGSRSLLISAGENFFSHCVLGLDTIQRTALNATVEFQSGAARTCFEDCIFPADLSTAAAGLIVLCASAATIDRITTFRRCTFYNVAAFSGGAAGTGAFKLVASAGGALLVDPACVEYGYTDWGYDAASKLQILVSGPVPTSSSSGIAVVNT